MLAHKLPPAETPAAFEFTNSWFAPHVVPWRELFGSLRPQRLLEVGCYEGQATAFMIHVAAEYCDPHLTCVDTWAGSVDLPAEAMAGVEARFDSNVSIARARTNGRGDFFKIKQPSALALATMIAAGWQPFDFIYIDGSHTAPDVLTDAVMAFQLLRVGGVMVFDDYTWCMEPQDRRDPLNMPKFAIDTFVNMFQRQLMFSPFGAGHAQYAVRKVQP